MNWLLSVRDTFDDDSTLFENSHATIFTLTHVSIVECILLSSNILLNDGSVDLKYRRHHHIFLKIACGKTNMDTGIQRDLIDCSYERNRCQHGS